MTRDLSRLFRPKSIAVLGGVWAENVIAQCIKAGFKGDIWPVHPKRDFIGGIACFRSLADLPHAPDAAFVGVNRQGAVDIMADLAAMKAGGAIETVHGVLEMPAPIPKVGTERQIGKHQRRCFMPRPQAGSHGG